MYDVFKENKKLKEVFQSLTATLIQQGLLCSSDDTPPPRTAQNSQSRGVVGFWNREFQGMSFSEKSFQ